MVKVIVGYSSELVLLGLKSLLQNSKFRICGEALMTDDLLELIDMHQPDLLIIPLISPQESGLAMCKRVKQQFPQINVVILSALADKQAVEAAHEEGADGYVLEIVKGPALINIFELIAKGNNFFDLTAHRQPVVRLTDEGPGVKRPVIITLTGTEQKIVALVAEGKTNKEIASILFISDKTVRNHLSRVLTKLRLTNRTQVAKYYYSNLNNNI
jgi:DNA-binding NarL/FixJ family response regulator